MHAHLCEVSSLESPQEAGRNPTWFSAEKTIRRLRKDRPKDQGDELAVVVDCASERIRRLMTGTSVVHNPSERDALRKVDFEVLDSPRAANWMERAAFLAYAGRSRRNGDSPTIELALQTYLRRVIRVDKCKISADNPRMAGKKQRLLVADSGKR